MLNHWLAQDSDGDWYLVRDNPMPAQHKLRIVVDYDGEPIPEDHMRANIRRADYALCHTVPSELVDAIVVLAIYHWHNDSLNTEAWQKRISKLIADQKLG